MYITCIYLRKNRILSVMMKTTIIFMVSKISDHFMFVFLIISVIIQFQMIRLVNFWSFFVRQRVLKTDDKSPYK